MASDDDQPLYREELESLDEAVLALDSAIADETPDISDVEALTEYGRQLMANAAKEWQAAAIDHRQRL